MILDLNMDLSSEDIARLIWTISQPQHWHSMAEPSRMLRAMMRHGP